VAKAVQIPSDLTNKELKLLTKEWQKRLRLKDWKLDCKMSDDLDGQCGLSSRVSWEYKTARIRIATIRSMVMSGVEPAEMDQEAVLIHELVHLLHWPIDTGEKDSTEEKIIENMVEMIAQSLVALKRERK
jgi:hypothetical protein